MNKKKYFYLSRAGSDGSDLSRGAHLKYFCFRFQMFQAKYFITDLTLEHCVVLGGEAGYLEAEVPGIGVTDHGVAGEARQLPLHAEPEPVLGPLQHPDLISHHARQHNLQRRKCQL